MKIKWVPSGPICPKCGGPNPKWVPCGSCDYNPDDPLIEENELLTKEQLMARVAILKFFGYQLPKKIKRFL